VEIVLVRKKEIGEDDRRDGRNEEKEKEKERRRWERGE
jgi:hypothetical protein